MIIYFAKSLKAWTSSQISAALGHVSVQSIDDLRYLSKIRVSVQWVLVRRTGRRESHVQEGTGRAQAVSCVIWSRAAMQLLIELQECHVRVIEKDRYPRSQSAGIAGSKRQSRLR